MIFIISTGAGFFYQQYEKSQFAICEKKTSLGFSPLFHTCKKKYSNLIPLPHVCFCFPKVTWEFYLTFQHNFTTYLFRSFSMSMENSHGSRAAHHSHLTMEPSHLDSKQPHWGHPHLPGSIWQEEGGVPSNGSPVFKRSPNGLRSSLKW